MSITRNRELSQFGSFIHIDDTTQNIGITSLSTPFVGIGTTNPGFKLDVNGDINFTGTFRQNGTSFVASRWLVSVGSSIYRLEGNVGIGTSTLPQKLTVVGNVSAGQFISTVTSGTAPLVVLSDTQVTNLNASFLRSKTPPTGDIVGTIDTQTLTNKTLTSPTINTAIIGSAGITFNGTSGTTALQASASASGTLTLPSATDTLVGRATSDTLTNKSIAAGSNTITGLTNSNLSGSAGISNANLANSTISGVSLGSNLNALTFTDYLISGGTYTGATARTVSVAGTSINTGNTLVARDISGDFTAGTVTLSGLTLSGALVLSNTTESIDKDTGCLILQGGIGVEKNANIGGGVTVTGNVTATTFVGNGTIPIGGIIMWSGAIANIPSGWALCNGSSSTPDLRDRFIVGAGSGYAVGGTGGSANATLVSHNHTATSTVSDPGHTHTANFNQGGIISSGGAFGWKDSGTGDRINPNTTGITVATTISTQGSSATNANLPPYYALAFIMRTT